MILATVSSIPEAKQIADVADAFRIYATKAKLGLSVQNHAASIAIKAKRKAGEMAAKLERKPGGRDKRTVLTGEGSSSPLQSAREDAKVSVATLDRWQTLAKQLTEEQIDIARDEATASEQELTTRSILKPNTHVANNSGENEWYTPTAYIEAARLVLGEIDLDPASCAVANRIVKASKFFTKEQDGLAQQWWGRVWMNPPYSQPLCGQFCEKLTAEFETPNVTGAIVLVNNATETVWFQAMAELAGAVCFPKGRIRFIDKDGNPRGAPLQGQAILYFGDDVCAFDAAFKSFGFVLKMVMCR